MMATQQPVDFQGCGMVLINLKSFITVSFKI